MIRIFRPVVLIPAFAGFLVGILTNILAEALIAAGSSAVLILIVITAALLLTALVYRHNRPIIGHFDAPSVIKTEVDKYDRDKAKEGLIVILSLYTPQRESPALALTIDERVAAAKNLDYETLRLEESNMTPLIQAVDAHARQLKHCWLIATLVQDGETGQVNEGQSSLTYAPLVERYLREKVGLKDCRFHSGERYALTVERDDALLADRARALVEQIYAEANKKEIGLKDRDIVADITGGMRSIAMGVIMACLDKRRVVQFIGSAYDAHGRPAGKPLPILLKYTVEMTDEE